MKKGPKKIYIGESEIHNKGIFASQNIKKGKIVTIIKGPKRFKINRNTKDALSNPDWVGFKIHNWIDPVPPYKHLNHSCNPNVAIKGHITLISIRDIKKNEEITIDYSITEADERWRMECFCKNKNCRNVIKSIQDLPVRKYLGYLPYISKEFQDLYKRKFNI